MVWSFLLNGELTGLVRGKAKVASPQRHLSRPLCQLGRRKTVVTIVGLALIVRCLA